MEFKGYKIKKLENRPENFGHSVTYYGLEDFPKEIQNLEHSYYEINSQYFKIKKNEFMECVVFPSRKENILKEWIDKKEEQEELERCIKEAYEINEWIDDLSISLIFGEDGKAHLKPFNGKKIFLIENDEYEPGNVWNLYANNDYEIELHKMQDGSGYSCYDGIEGYRRDENMKKAVEYYLKERFRNKEHDVSCTNCGDGGCIHCEPHRFIVGYIY